jgi:ATP-dependent Clp protease ATP-binding subunit ClpC
VRGYNFTDDVRRALANAREAAARLNHEYVGAEHMLLGILHRDEGTAMRMLDELDVDPEDLRARIEGMVKRGNAAPDTGPVLPYTNRAKVVLELAMKEAQEVGHAYVGSEHLLIGLLREEKGIAAQVLIDAGVTKDNARAAMLAVLGQARASIHVGEDATETSDQRTPPTLVVVEVRYVDGWMQRREFRTPAEAMAFLADR